MDSVEKFTMTHKLAGRFVICKLFGEDSKEFSSQNLNCLCNLIPRSFVWPLFQILVQELNHLSCFRACSEKTAYTLQSSPHRNEVFLLGVFSVWYPKLQTAIVLSSDHSAILDHKVAIVKMAFVERSHDCP